MAVEKSKRLLFDLLFDLLFSVEVGGFWVNRFACGVLMRFVRLMEKGSGC